MTKSGVESYIVRVYRRDEEDPQIIAGMVEVVRTGLVKKFADRDELCGVICRNPGGKKRKVRKAPPGDAKK